MKIIYTWGVFDLLHVGHIKLLEDAKALGDYLIVGVFTDEVAKSFKRKPIIPFKQRIKMLRALKIVNFVVPQKTLQPTIEKKDWIFAKGPGATWEKNYRQIGKKFGARTVLLKYHKGASTTDIIKRCKKA